MTGPDIPDLDRQGFGRPEHQDMPSISDVSLAALLSGLRPPAGSAPQLCSLAESLAILTDRPDSDELGGEAETLAAFRARFAAPGRVHRSRRREPRRLPRSRPVRSAAAVLGAAVFSFGGLAAAAYAGALPTPLQRLAHEIIAAPAPHAQPASSPSPAVTSHAARAGTHSSHRPHQAPASPGSGGSRGAPTPHGAGEPGGLPTPHSSGKPTGLPSPGESGKPTAPPTPGSSGKPTGLPSPRASSPASPRADVTRGTS